MGENIAYKFYYLHDKMLLVVVPGCGGKVETYNTMNFIIIVLQATTFNDRNIITRIKKLKQSLQHQN